MLLVLRGEYGNIVTMDNSPLFPSNPQQVLLPKGKREPQKPTLLLFWTEAFCFMFRRFEEYCSYAFLTYLVMCQMIVLQTENPREADAIKRLHDCFPSPTPRSSKNKPKNTFRSMLMNGTERKHVLPRYILFTLYDR